MRAFFFWGALVLGVNIWFFVVMPARSAAPHTTHIGPKVSIPSPSVPQALVLPPEQQILRFNLYSEPMSLDPRLVRDVSSQVLSRHLFDGLTRIDKDGTPQPAIAESIEISDDYRTYIFRLRDAVWSNGDPVRSQDFVYAWKSLLQPDYPSEIAEQLYVIKNGQKVKSGELASDELGIFAADDKTLVVALEYPSTYFLEMLANSYFFPINEKVAKSNPRWSENSTSFVSNGPFLLRRWRPHQDITLRRNQDYWDASHVRLDEVHCFIVDDSHTDISLFEEGTTDWVGSPMSELPGDVLVPMGKKGKIRFGPATSLYFFILNTEVFPLNNRKVRQALSRALNRASIVEHIFGPGQKVATQVIPPQLSRRYLGLQSEFAELEKARSLFEEGLKELGTTRKDLPTLIISYNRQTRHEQVAQEIQQQLRKALGLDIRLQNQEWNSYLSELSQGNFHIGRLGLYAVSSDPLEFLRTWYETFPITWKSPRFEELLQQARLSENAQERTRLVAEAEALIFQEMPMIPICHGNSVYMKNPRLKGAYLTPLGYPDFKRAYKE